jgi:hypothetical protein
LDLQLGLSTGNSPLPSWTLDQWEKKTIIGVWLRR